MNEREAFEAACELLPKEFMWGDTLTPETVLHIAFAANVKNENKTIDIDRVLKIFESVDSVALQCGESPESIIDWLTDKGGLTQLILSYFAAIASQAQQPVKPFIYISEDEFAWRSKSGDLNGTRSLTCITPQHFGETHYRNFTVPLYLQSQAQQSQWISVEERLPDHTDDVLCYCIALFEPIATIKTSHLNPAKTGFYVEYDNGGLEPLEKVTHWMPIPPAPEGE